MTPEFYKLVHLIGVLLLFLGLGGVMATSTGEGRKPSRTYLMLHGIGLLAMLVAGIGAWHKSTTIQGFPLWLVAKVGVWLLLGALPMLVRRGLVPHAFGWLVAGGLGGLAVWLVLQKPF